MSMSQQQQKAALLTTTKVFTLCALLLLPLYLPAATKRVSRPDGDVDLVETQAGSPFTIIRRELQNPGTKDREVRMIEFVQPVTLVGSATEYRSLGVDGLKGAESPASSYLFLAIARPDASHGNVAGWITQERGSGSVHSQYANQQLSITGRLEFGCLRIKPGKSVITDAFVMGSFADARQGLETYADTIAQVNHIKLPKIPNGYCTWYSSPHGGASDEKAMAELAAFCGKELTKYGFDTVLVDDQWQGPAIKKGGLIGSGPTGNFTRHDPQGPYPSGMKANAERLAANGLRAGLWFTPFAWDPRDPLFKDHPDWFVKKTDGSLYEVLWAGWCLDMTHPEARAFLADSVQRITHEWGYHYLKPDAMWCGLAAKCTYPGTAYVDEKFGDAVFHDPYLTGIEAYRLGIRTMREAAGPDTYIAACNVAQNFRSMGGAIGLVDAMRIGPDTGADWGAILPNFNLGTRLYFLHNRVWHNDPDCLMVRAPLSLTQARSFASWIALSGSLNLVSEWLPSLPAERLDCIKRSMPNTGLAARPLDLFANMPARVWHLTDGRRHVVGLFNWSASESVVVPLNLKELGLQTEGAKFIGLDYWSGNPVALRENVISAELPPSGCSIIAIAKILNRPQLLGTSRHITHCFVDVGEEVWDNARLSGACKLVAGDPTELRITRTSTSGTWKALTAELLPADRERGVTVGMKKEPGLLRVTLSAPINCEVHWTISFDPHPEPNSTSAGTDNFGDVYVDSRQTTRTSTALARPTRQQYAWHEQERIMFVCLDPATWQGREYDNHTTPLSAINPAQLETDQWYRAAQLWGAKEILFVAKHTGGFCWWQTGTSTYGVKETPWREGRGDVMKDLAASCRKQGMKLGVYLSPNDDVHGAAGGGRCKTPEAQETYNQIYRQQLTELLSHYGEIFEIWFDGSCVINVSDLLQQHAPTAMVFQGPQATIRWPGTESGRLPYPAWNSLSRQDLKTGVATAAQGNPDGDVWAPLEADTTLYNHNWFWSVENEKKRKNLDELMDIYYQSVGRGGVLLLNSTPNTNGLIPEDDLKLYTAFGKEIERRFSQPIAEVTNRTGTNVEITLSPPRILNHAVLMEDYREGERIRAYVLEGLIDGQWKELSRGISVGRKKIDSFRSVLVSRVRLRVTESVGESIIRRFSVFNVEGVSASRPATGQ
jgi:alpha-L-fucosidase